MKEVRPHPVEYSSYKELEEIFLYSEVYEEDSLISTPIQTVENIENSGVVYKIANCITNQDTFTDWVLFNLGCIKTINEMIEEMTDGNCYVGSIANTCSFLYDHKLKSTQYIYPMSPICIGSSSAVQLLPRPFKNITNISCLPKNIYNAKLSRDREASHMTLIDSLYVDPETGVTANSFDVYNYEIE